MLSKTIIKYIQSLAQKKVRDKDGVFVAEGPKLVKDLLASKKFKCQTLCALPGWLNDNAHLIKNISTEIMEVTDFELQQISLMQTPNNVLAILCKKEEIKMNLKDTISLMLDGIQDPGNMGTIIRTADWFGVNNIICSAQCADCYNPKVVQSTMGSLASVNILYTNLIEFLKVNQEINVYPAVLSGKSIYELKKINEGIILIGNEAKGVSEELLNFGTQLITIPKIGSAESLNAAVATGIILSEITR